MTFPPTRPPLAQLRPGGRYQEQRPLDSLEQPFEEVEQGLLGPVQIFDEHDCRLIGRELGQELGPGVLEAITGDKGMELACYVEPKGKG